MNRRDYDISIIVNRQQISRVVIDPHYEQKHSESISDEIVLELVKTLDGQVIAPEDVSPPYSYFVTDRIELKGRFYKLVWLLEDDQIYVGVINAYRR